MSLLHQLSTNLRLESPTEWHLTHMNRSNPGQKPIARKLKPCVLNRCAFIALHFPGPRPAFSIWSCWLTQEVDHCLHCNTVWWPKVISVLFVACTHCMSTFTHTFRHILHGLPFKKCQPTHQKHIQSHSHIRGTAKVQFGVHYFSQRH